MADPIKVLTYEGLSYYDSKATARMNAAIASAVAGKVDKVEGKGLSTNDFTDALKTKLEGVAEGAQVNVIESVKVNGTALEITDKAVNVDLSAYAIKTDVQASLDGKVDKAEGMSLMSDAEKAKIANLASDANATYATKDEVSAIPKFAIKPVDQLPTADISETTVYLVPNSGSGTNARDEYIYVNGAWEMLGTTEVDLSGYYTSAQVDEKIAAIEGDVGAVYTKTEIDGMVNTINGAIDAVEEDVALKANSADVYTKGQVDSAISTATTDMATNAGVDAKIAALDTYTAISNAEIDGLFSA